MSQRRRPSLLGALLWIGLGILFLLRNFGIGRDFWSLAGRYWPILLILLGLGKVLDYFLKKDAVSIRIGEIFGILVLLLIGAALTKISDSQMGRIFRDVPIRIGGTSVRPGQFIGESHAYSEEKTYPLDRPMPIRVENSYGSVSISPGSDREVRVRLKKVVYAGETRARNIAAEILLDSAAERRGEPSAPLKPEAEPGKKTADYFVVRTNREALSSKDYEFKTDMEIFVPKESQLQVANTFGEVRVVEIKGKMDLSTTHEDLVVRDCTGPFTLFTQNAADARLTNLVGNVSFEGRGKVYLEGIKGDVSVTDEFSPVEIQNVDGKVTVSNTDGSIRIREVSKPVVIDSRGTRVTAANLKGSLKVTANYGQLDISEVASDITVESSYLRALTLKDIGGNVEIKSNSDRIDADEISGRFVLKGRAGSVRLNGVTGFLNIETARTDITVNNLAGGCNITDEYADVSVSAESLGKGDIRIKNQTGVINLFLPEEASFSINAVARNGKIESDYPGLEPAGNEGNAGTLRSKVKTGGTNITLETDYSSIHIYSARKDKSNPVKRGDEARASRPRMRMFKPVFLTR